MKHLLLLVLASVILSPLLAQPVSAQTQVSHSTPLEGPIRVLDRLYIVIGGMANRKGQFTVQMNGAISVPGGEIRVIDRMPADVVTDIQKRLEARGLKNTPITVHIVARQTRQVIVEGAVAFAGKQTVLEQTHLSDALKLASVQADADLSHVTVIHSNGSSTVHDCRTNSSLSGENKESSPLLEDNDRIQVPRSSGVLGLVSISGEIRDTSRVAIPLTAGATVGQVLQLVGGISEWADRANIVIRRGDRQIPVPYDEILRNTPGKDIPLQNQDHIVVARLNRPAQFTISGAVRDSKSYPLTSGVTLPQALLLAGGAQDGTEFNRVELRRLKSDGSLTTTLYNVQSGEGRLVEIADGDSIFVRPAARRKRIDWGRTLNLAGSAFFLLGQIGR